MVRSKWITPFLRQYFVVVGVSMAMAQFGLVFGFTAVLLPQLKSAASSIVIDETSGSWIAAIPGFALLIGNFTIPSVMAKYGRKVAILISYVITLIGWFCMATASSVVGLLVARFLQGTALGMNSCISPIAIGEYSSPINRGSLLTTMSLIMSIGTFIVHGLGSYLHWQTTSLACTFITFAGLLIILFSPETPSWLADQGQYEKCTKVFHWLRGTEEDDELQKMIEANILKKIALENARESTSIWKSVKSKINYFNDTIKKKEFYKPILIVIHIYAIQQWAGANILAPFAEDVVINVVGSKVNKVFVVLLMDFVRTVTSFFLMYLVKKMKRRTMLVVFVGLNTLILFVVAAYTYFKKNEMLPFDHPSIGIILILIHMFSVSTGSLPLPLTIAGEIFPLEYRSISGGITTVFLSINLFVSIKTVPTLFKGIGFHGAYILYGVITAYCLLIAYIFLPETKDRTLQEIEEEFKGRRVDPEEVKAKAALL